MKITPRLMKFMLNVYPPYLGAGVKVDYFSEDWREAKVSMKLTWYNRNAVGTQFGGSLYSMVDPHLMLMLMRILGDDYIVWDKSAQIDFIKPGKGKVHSIIRIPEERIDEIYEKTKDGKKFLPEFEIEVLDESDKIISRIRKTLYIRKKRVRD
ncbi:MAG: DUF4442 domain-containing protein [Ignavibacteria bacterium]|nr:MAG: DUF4442 domain-containing protein [Ignavibacteria bacterium]